jgi:hypothetical protein
MADSLREALVTAMETAPVEVAPEPAPVESAPVETEQQKADRARDEAGRFTKNSTEPALGGGKPTANAVTPAVQPAAVEPRKPPSSWKKEYWEQFAQLPEPVAKYIGEREEQFASGVSTYKQEAERAKVLWDAIAPFQEDLNRYNIQPTDWIRQLGTAHQMLAKGSPEQKLQMFQKLAQDYNVPLHAVQTGQVDPVSQYVSPLQEQVRQLQGQLNSWQQEKEQSEQQKLQSDIQAFAAQHEHYEAVRDQMAGLLQSGIATDLQGAYDKALRLNDDLWKAEQQRQSEAAAERQRQEQQARVNKAKSNAVSPRSDTPSGSMVGEGKKGLRSNLEEAAASILGGGRL